MIRWLLSLFRRKPKHARAPVDPTTAETDLLPPVRILTALEACAEVLLLVERDRRQHPAALIHYDDVVNRVWAMLPDDVRGEDTAVNRAEFASAVRAAIRLYDDVDLWMQA